MVFSMRTLDFKKIVESFSVIEQFLGKGWLEKQLAIVNSQKPSANSHINHSFLERTPQFHPFALTFRNAVRAFQECISKKYLKVTQELMDVTVLADYIKSLSIIGIVDRAGNPVNLNLIKKLSSRFKNLYDFEKVRYELQISSAYARRYRHIYFVQESKVQGEKTPDLYLKFNSQIIQIECKKKDNLSERDRKNNDIWKKIAIRCLDYMGKNKLNYLVIFRFDSDPTPNKVDEAYQYFMKIVQESKTDISEIKAPDFSVEIEKIAEPDELIPISRFKTFKRNEYFDNEFFSGHCNEPTISPTSIFKNPKFVCFKSKEYPDRIKLVLRSLREAKEQIIEGIPSLIYIEMNPSVMRDEDFPILEEKILELLESKINAVILTMPPVIGINDIGGSYLHKAKVILNPRPASPLPTNFEIIGTAKEAQN